MVATMDFSLLVALRVVKLKQSDENGPFSGVKTAKYLNWAEPSSRFLTDREKSAQHYGIETKN
jgi:hypothetical protein